jgi:hypothetical protein
VPHAAARHQQAGLVDPTGHLWPAGPFRESRTIIPGISYHVDRARVFIPNIMSFGFRKSFSSGPFRMTFWRIERFDGLARPHPGAAFSAFSLRGRHYLRSSRPNILAHAGANSGSPMLVHAKLRAT